jgi:hypothetical protein
VGAHIGCKRPFTEPYLVLDLISDSRIGFVVITELLSGIHSGVPSLVIVVVHNNLVVIVISEHFIPKVCVVNEGIVEDKVSLWSVCLNKGANVSIEIHKDVDVCV